MSTKMCTGISAHRLVNQCNTAAEEAKLVDVKGLPNLCLCTSCTVLATPDLSRIRSIVTRVGSSVENSLRHYLSTSYTFSNV